MSMTLEFPEHVWKEKSVKYGIEVSIDFLPPEFEGNWLPVVYAASEKWVRSKKFDGKATLWMWGTVSINFQAVNDDASWSEFVIPVGLPESFLIFLHAELTKSFGNKVRFSEGIQLRRAEGWAAICHIENGRAWVEEDANLWIPFDSKSKP